MLNAASHPTVEYPQAWYPLLCSAELGRGRTLAVTAFGADLLAWRGRDGQAAVMTRHCAHMGADLAHGAVSGNDLVCPLHRLHIDLSGRGRFGVESSPIAGPCQFALPVEERYGLLFVHLGMRATRGVPAPAFPHAYRSRPFAREFDTSFDAMCLNSFDREHFGPVHGREVIAYELVRREDGGLQANFRSRIAGTTLVDRVMRAAGMREVGIEVVVYGGNLALMHNARTGAGALIATLPVHAQRSRLFVVTFGAAGGRGWMGAIGARARSAVQSRLVMRFLGQDMRVLDGMRVQLAPALLASDPVLRAWHDYLHALPRTSIRRLTGGDNAARSLSVVA